MSIPPSLDAMLLISAGSSIKAVMAVGFTATAKSTTRWRRHHSQQQQHSPCPYPSPRRCNAVGLARSSGTGGDGGDSSSSGKTTVVTVTEKAEENGESGEGSNGDEDDDANQLPALPEAVRTRRHRRQRKTLSAASKKLLEGARIPPALAHTDSSNDEGSPSPIDAATATATGRGGRGNGQRRRSGSRRKRASKRGDGDSSDMFDVENNNKPPSSHPIEDFVVQQFTTRMLKCESLVAALHLLKEARSLGVIPGDDTYRALFTVARRAGESDAALRLRGVMRAEGIAITESTLAVLVSAILCDTGLYDKALEVVSEAREYTKPGKATYAALTHCCKRQANAAINSLNSNSNKPSKSSISSGSNAHANAKRGDRERKARKVVKPFLNEIERLIREMAEDEVEVDSFIAAQHMDCAFCAGEWETAVARFDSLRKAKVTIEPLAYQTVIIGLGRAGKIERAVEAFEHMYVSPGGTTTAAYNALLVSLSAARKVPVGAAFGLWDEVKTLTSAKSKPDHVTYSAMLSISAKVRDGRRAHEVAMAADKANAWPQNRSYCRTMLRKAVTTVASDSTRGTLARTLDIVEIMKKLKLRKEATTLGAVLSAAAAEGDGVMSATVLEEYVQSGVVISTAMAHRAVDTAARIAADWESATRCVDAAERADVTLSPQSLEQVICACVTGGKGAVDALALNVSEPTMIGPSAPPRLLAAVKMFRMATGENKEKRNNNNSGCGNSFPSARDASLLDVGGAAAAVLDVLGEARLAVRSGVPAGDVKVVIAKGDDGDGDGEDDNQVAKGERMILPPTNLTTVAKTSSCDIRATQAFRVMEHITRQTPEIHRGEDGGVEVVLAANHVATWLGS